MSIMGKSMATTISMIMLVLSLAVVSPTTAVGKGIRRTGTEARAQQETNLKVRNLRQSGKGLRAASGARNPKQGNSLLVGGAGGAGSLGLMDYQGNPVTTYLRK